MNASVLESTVDEGAAAVRPKFIPLRGNLDEIIVHQTKDDSALGARRKLTLTDLQARLVYAPQGRRPRTDDDIWYVVVEGVSLREPTV